MHAKKETSRPFGDRDHFSLNLHPVYRAVALVFASGAVASAHASPVNLAGLTAQVSASRNQAIATGVPLLGVSPQQALRASQPSIQNLATSAQMLAAQMAAQQRAAQAAAGSPSNVPNGLAPGGLQVAPGASNDPNNPVLWINANLPQQTTNSDGSITVDVKQNAQNAVLTWQTMNVGSRTTLNFDQSAGTQTNGTNNWVVLNRIQDPSGAPSQILGHVTAQGSVYVVNRNGILFGAGSQVNVHSLVASSLDLLDLNDDAVQTAQDVINSNQRFLSLTGGLAALQQGETGDVVSSQSAVNEVLGLGNQINVGASGSYQAPGAIVIAPGASISTHTTGTSSDGGLVVVAAPNVTNGGSITADDGQVILAAGVGLAFQRPTSNYQVLLPLLSGRVVTSGNDITPVGVLTNTGIVQAARGTIDLLGGDVHQNGAVAVTTSVNTPGSIVISAEDEFTANTPTGAAYPSQSLVTVDTANGLGPERAGTVFFSGGSLAAALPDNGGQTATSTPGTTFTPGSISVSGGSVWLQSGSLIEAPGSNVSVAALSLQSGSSFAQAPGDTTIAGRVYMDSGAIVDVSGLANVELPISDILLTVGLVGQNELADSPLLRDSILFDMKNVVVDSTLTGTTLDGVQWVGSPILNLAGAVNLMPRTIDQLLTNGGTLSIAGQEVITAAGSSINLNGGYVHYLGGNVYTTRLIDASGAIVPIGSASPYDTFIGIAGEFVEKHSRWNVTRDWFNPLIAGSAYEDDFIVGGNAGTLNVFATDAVVLDGSISAQAFGGTKQAQGNTLPAGGSFNLGKGAALTLGTSTGITGETANIILQGSAPDLNAVSPGFSASTPLSASGLGSLPSTDPNNVVANVVVPVNTLNNAGFSNVSVTDDKNGGGSIVVADGTKIEVQAGGSIALSATRDIDVSGQLVAPSGKISLSVTGIGGITVEDGAVLDVAGQWINNDTRASSGTTLGSSEYINGGSISLSVSPSAAGQPGLDATGSIVLQEGSTLDVSSGGEVQSNGQMLMKNGIPVGLGGNVSLSVYGASAYTSPSNSGLPGNMPNTGRIEMDGTIDSFGFSGGGTLSVVALGIQIGGNAATAAPWDVVLPSNFFSQQGFSNYILNAFYDATIEPGTQIALTQKNRLPDINALMQAPTGTNIELGGLTTVGTLDAYHRQPTDLVVTAGGYVGWKDSQDRPIQGYPGVTGTLTMGANASIVADAGASIGLGSSEQVTVLGTLIAPGGAITLTGDTAADGTELPGQFSQAQTVTNAGKSVWLGDSAVLDVSGVTLVNPLAAPVRIGTGFAVPTAGKVLGGGSVTLSDDSGYIVAQQGSRINVSGTSAVLDEPTAGGSYAPSNVWSDAGSITIRASSGLAFDGTLEAQAGAPQAQGGTFALIPVQNAAHATVIGSGSVAIPGATSVIFQQSGNLVPAGLAPGQAFATADGSIRFAADRLTGSGVGTLIVGDSTGTQSVASVPIAFAGNVDLNASSAVILDATRFVALPANSTSLPALTAGTNASIGAPTLTIDAPYVGFVGQIRGTFAPVSALADGTLNVNASFIDFVNLVELDQIGQANFHSTGDIRFTSRIGGTQTGSIAPGELFSSGNLTFVSADLYPSTGSTFVIEAVGPVDASSNTMTPTTVSFLPSGTASPSAVPLSAGGSLLVDATQIVQGGTVRAPSGSIILGVGDPTDAATQALFNNTTVLAATQSVVLGNGSITSVSNDGATIPFGVTVDGSEWQFNPVGGSTATDVTRPPAKYVGLNGSSVALNSGATVDLSGGGDLQAVEWVPGTGGSRDVLAQYNVSYATTPSGVALPTNVGASNVYAILPGAQAPVAAYDPMFAQTLQPSVNGNGTVATEVDNMAVGSAALNAVVGQSVFLSGVPGLAPGMYTLLPARYATLPGAYRVTLAAVNGAAIPGASQTLPDGTIVTTGYFGNALSGSRSATPVSLDLQSAAVWGQYSQYTETSANAFFSALSVTNGTVAPMLPRDAGQLVLSATHALSLGGTLNSAAGPGGAPAEVDIASQDIQIVGSGEAALPGYLQINASQLDALDAGSLLIGGTRTQTSSGITIDALANSVVVSNDAAHPLSGPEILLVTRSDASGTDPNAATGLRFDSGSVVTAQGAYPASKDSPITIGQYAAGSASAVSGDGSLVIVTDGGPSVVTRLNTTGTGVLNVNDGATLSGGQALTLDSSGTLTFSPTASLSGNTIAIDGSAITFTDDPAGMANTIGFVAGPAQLAQLGAANTVILRSAGAMTFDGNLNIDFAHNAELSAGTFVSNGGAVSIDAQQLALTNDTGAGASTSSSGAGTLTIHAGEIDLGAGDRSTQGFGSVVLNATNGIAAQGNGTLDIGAQSVAFNTPVVFADTGSDQIVKAAGELDINAASGTALNRIALGGAWSFTAQTVNVNGLIEAAAGNVAVEATQGNLTISNGAQINTAGVALPFFDVVEYAPAGTISLTADAGSVVAAAGSTLDFSGATNGGAAGGLTLSAPAQAVQLNGTIEGIAAHGYAGGSFALNTGGAVDLDSLAAELASSGINTAISVNSGAGNLILSAGNTLTAHSVRLTADGGTPGSDTTNGAVKILGTIDASGPAGGEIDLYGKSLVDVEGTLYAVGGTPGATPSKDVLTANQRGGTVNIGTVGTPDTVSGVIQFDPTYGYESVSSSNSGTIMIGANALIDVSGGTAGGLTGGTVNFRLPLLAGGTSVNLNLPAGFSTNKGIYGSRATQLEAYAVWSTIDPTTGAQHFDGVVDPAGWYQDTVANGGQPAMVPGTWTDENGNTLPAPTASQLASYLANDTFTPSTANPDHQGFYGYLGGSTSTPGTLMSFVENGLTNLSVTNAASVPQLIIAPGIELDNPSTAINNGNISVLSTWNLGAGTSTSDLAYRFNGVAPVVTFRAAKSVIVDATLTDGFFQIANPLGGGGTIPVPPSAYYQEAANYYNAPHGSYGYTFAYYGKNGRGISANLVSFPALVTSTKTDLDEYYALYMAYAEYLASAPNSDEQRTVAMPSGSDILDYISQFRANSVVPGQPIAPSAPTSSDPAAYLTYLNSYEGYVESFALYALAHSLPHPQLTAPSAPNPNHYPDLTGPITIPAAADNSPSPQRTAANPLPVLSASLAGGSSTSFRIASGADFSSADPLALQPAASFSGSSDGSVILDGHQVYTLTNGHGVVVPTMIRTGAGSIEIASANNVDLADTSAPGVIYTGGVPDSASPGVSGAMSIDTSPNNTNPLPAIVIGQLVNPDGAGDVVIRAQHDIVGVENVVDQSGSVTGVQNANMSQFWWPWLEVGNDASTGVVTRSSINFAAFDQGIMSVGGNVTIAAGGNITDLGVSLPTSWFRASNGNVVTVGGGNLQVSAGGNILSGDYFVAAGHAAISAGGSVAPDGQTYTQFDANNGINVSVGAPVATLLATQNGTLEVEARQGVEIGTVVDPSYLNGWSGNFITSTDAQGYSTSSAVSVSTTTGDIRFGTLDGFANSVAKMIGVSGNDYSFVLPSTVVLTALTGGIDVESGGALAPSPFGQLSLIAAETINVTNQANGPYLGLAMLDVDPSTMPSPNSQTLNANALTQVTNQALLHDATALHSTDVIPARIYSLDGSIVDGTLETTGSSAGFYDNLLQISVDKQAVIEAGQDIVNLAFQGQNLRNSDLTRIVAGRDIFDAPFEINGIGTVPSLVLGGPGTFDVEAGRNIGPLSSQKQIAGHVSNNPLTGIDAVGNAENPFLPHESASIDVLFGIAPGMDDKAFIAAYIDPATSTSTVASAMPALIQFMENYDNGQGVATGVASSGGVTLDAQQAWSQFQALPDIVQRLLVNQVFFNILSQVGNDYNNAASPYHGQYARGYTAINTLFPASLGYTANSLGGGSNGANATVTTGNLDIRNSTIQTQQGGNVMILGPGGQALIGSSSAPPEIVDSVGNVVAGPSTMGVLTLEKGDVDIFTDKSLLLAQSRVFTEQGGNMTIWSSNGDIDAGKGATTSADIPAPLYVCDVNHFCTVDARGEVTGAGIATLQTIPSAAPGDVNLIAPRGTVDAGAAGIRVSGNLNIAALQVSNAANIQVKGVAIGIPSQGIINTGALTAANAAASAASLIAKDTAARAADTLGRRWVVTVEVSGFGRRSTANDKDCGRSGSSEDCK